MFGILVFSYRHIDKKFILFILLTYLLGCAAEWLGVNKHWLFGDYSYGTTLGIAVFGVPLIIGVNWFLLTWSAGALMQRTKLNNPALRIVAGSLLLVLLDLLIEPVAVHFDYWHWGENKIPLENYVCWFLLSGLILSLFELFRFRKQSMVAPVFLAVEFVFFIILYFAVR
jgi:putative membrane protein